MKPTTTPETQSLDDKKTPEVLPQAKATVVEEEQSCLHCRVRETCGDTNGSKTKKRGTSLCEAEIW